MKGKRVLLGMSGGVDSSASAILLQKDGYEVVGCTMKLWNQPDEENKAVEDAKKVCNKLKIEHHIIDYKEEFKCCVIDKFINEYKNGRTPNPCVECNKYLKFGLFLEKARELNCNFIATGHYASIEFSEKYQQYVLKKSKEEKKDQSYFLYSIKKEELKHIVFPLQDYTSKEDTRELANQSGLEVARKKDSQEICFIPDNDYKNFLLNNMEKNPKQGNIILKTGEILGKHKGLIHYTVGQRKGLGIAYKEPLYVIKIDILNNQVIVGTEEDLYGKTLYANEVNWLIMDELRKELECYAKIRYRAKEAKAKVYPENGKIKVEFVEPQRAITPGQSVVFYDEEGIVLGGAKIQ